MKESDNSVVLAAQSFGSGRIILSGSVWTYFPSLSNKEVLNHHYKNGVLEPYDNERLAINIDQWLTGYPIPGSLPVASASSPVKPAGITDVVSMKNGDIIKGLVQNSAFTLKASYASISFPTKDIARITLEGTDSAMDVLILNAGDKLSGVLQDETLLLKLESGTVLNLDMENVAEISLAQRP